MSQEIYTIFYSWQSDDGKSSQLIDNALSVAIEQIKQEHHIVVTIDKSTLDVAGMPNITQTIMGKIDKCDVFLCDLTPVVEYHVNGNDGQKIKKVPNANVLIELGYAMSALGVHYIIPLCHQGNFDVENLPFDINHHSIKVFNSANIDLVEPILGVIRHIHKYGSHRQITEPYWVSKVKVLVRQLYHKKKSKYDRSVDTISQPSTVLFRERMCNAFPGQRGVVEYRDTCSIIRCLKSLLRNPVKFNYRAMRNCSIDPVWWFSGGDALPIDEFEHIGGRRIRLGINEYLVGRIIAYADDARYYSNYVYVEIIPDKPLQIYPKPSQELLQNYIEEQCAYTQEYAKYEICPLISKKITRHEYDDGCFTWFGKVVYLKGRAKLRSRTITPYSFIIAAKFSPYNCNEFNRTSEEKLELLRKGVVSKKSFNEYMMRFPKNQLDE